MFHLTTALDAASGVPLYEQLYESLAAEMRSGAIPAGTRMPGKRRLAAELSVSVNTVDAAYQILATEGYMEPRERSGFYVQEYLALPTRPEKVPPPVSAAPPEAAEPPVRFDLSTRGVDPGLFPFRTWARLQKELLYSSPQLLTHGDAQGDVELRQALAEYLSEYRGVQCGPHQIVVGAGLEYLLGLLAPLLPGPAAVETPGYPRALQVLQNNGVHCCCLPVDEDGLSVEALNRSDAAVCYVTPSHQFPTGVTMPAGRRAELLHWAARRPGGRYIIEDDYDSEFRFDTRPLPSLQGMAGADGPVVYLSTCSRSLAPSIRIAYMVLPEHLLPAWRKKYRLYSGTVSRFEQQTLARFITEGYFTRHLARERVAYKARRDALTAALNTAFAPGELTLAGLHTGLNLLAKLKDPPPDAALRCAAEAEGVQLSLLSDYDLTGEAPSAAGTLVLGYGSLKDEACASVGETLKKVCMAAREASVTV
jgi:GntR family transcriptional regulator/MocR family aminotransferase